MSKATRTTGMTSHTPGPWKLEYGKVYGLNGQYITRDVSDGKHYVARMDGSTMSAIAQDANARLITAAPELLAACQAVDNVSRSGDAMAFLIELRRVAALCHTAIAKATGDA